MGISKLTATRIILLTFCLGMVLLGLAYIWHYVPARPYFGVLPPAGMATEEGWYAYNEITGWALVFCGATTLFFVLFAGLKIKTMGKLIGLTLVALALSLVFSSVAAEIITNIIK